MSKAPQLVSRAGTPCQAFFGFSVPLFVPYPMAVLAWNQPTPRALCVVEQVVLPQGVLLSLESLLMASLVVAAGYDLCGGLHTHSSALFVHIFKHLRQQELISSSFPAS